MNDKLQEKLTHLENMIGIQEDCVRSGCPAEDYMHGLANGMILAHSIFIDENPKYIVRKPKKKKSATLSRVRHKCVFPKGSDQYRER